MNERERNNQIIAVEEKSVLIYVNDFEQNKSQRK